jgi:spore germination protein GerM
MAAMLCGLLYACAQGSSAAQTKAVKVYFLKEPYDNSDPENPAGLKPVTRKVSAKSPLREALLALTAGPSRAERKNGYDSPTWGIQLLSVKIKDGTAYTYFTMPEGATFSGDNSPFIFEDAVKMTASQFPNVRKVVVCLDGILDFGSESDEPPRKCPKI